MSCGNPCTCKGTQKEKRKHWAVIHRNCNYSHFEKPKGQKHYSDYSLIKCMWCLGLFRSKANYVHELPDGKIDYPEGVNGNVDRILKAR